MFSGLVKSIYIPKLMKIAPAVFLNRTYIQTERQSYFHIRNINMH